MLSFDNHPETDLRFGKKKHLTKLGEYYEGST